MQVGWLFRIDATLREARVDTGTEKGDERDTECGGDEVPGKWRCERNERIAVIGCDGVVVELKSCTD